MALPQFIRAASPNAILPIFIQDSTSTTGAGKTGLSSSSTGLTVKIKRELDSAWTSYTVAGSTIEAVTTIGTYAAPTASKVRFGEIGDGAYELHLAQALLGTADASRFLLGIVKGATNAADCPFVLPLAAVDIQSATSFITGVNGQNPPTNWGVMTIDGVGRIDVGKILGTASQGAAGYVGIDWSKINAPTTAQGLSGTTVGTVTTLTGNTPQTGDNFARLGAPAGASHAADVAAVKADTAAVKIQTDKLVFTNVGKVDAQTRGMDTDVITAAALNDTAAAEIRDKLLTATLDGSFTMQQVLKLLAAALGGKVSGAGTTSITFRNLGDTVDAIVATVDTNGNRTAVALTL